MEALSFIKGKQNSYQYKARRFNNKNVTHLNKSVYLTDCFCMVIIKLLTHTLRYTLRYTSSVTIHSVNFCNIYFPLNLSYLRQWTFKSCFCCGRSRSASCIPEFRKVKVCTIILKRDLHISFSVIFENTNIHFLAWSLLDW